MGEEEGVVRVSFTKCLVYIAVHPSVTDLMRARCSLGIQLSLYYERQKYSTLPGCMFSGNIGSKKGMKIAFRATNPLKL